MNAEAEVAKIIAQVLRKKVENIKKSTRLVEDLGADSLDVVELLMAFEEKFDMTVSDDEALKFKTVGDIVSYIERAKK